MAPSHGGLSIELTTSVQDERPIFLAGNFNNWAVNDQAYQLEATAPGHYRFSFSPDKLPEVLEYKYLRGDWQQVELDEYGNGTPNRVVRPKPGTRIRDHVPRWRRDGYDYRPEFLPLIRVIDQQFAIPDHIKTRRISVLLPHNYDQAQRHYPVLYLQDGQNLFDDYAPFGNWAVDKKLALLAEKGRGDLIVVAIDHAENERIAEFTPSHRTKLGRGEGKEYVQFLAETLKPFIDSRFRTLPERQHTGIGGSSMGGLISIYAGLMAPEVYGKLLVFSPSLWVDPNIHSRVAIPAKPFATRVYLYGGAKESASMIPSLERLKNGLASNTNNIHFEFFLSTDPHGKHNEVRWGEEFPKAVSWLFYE